MPTLVPKSDFLALDEYIHLAAGGEPAQLKSAEAALREFLADKSRGIRGRERFFIISQEVRQRLAQLLNVEPTDLAFVGSASDATNLICWSLEWQPGDNVVLNNLDYPSMLYPFAALRERKGIEIRMVQAHHFDLTVDDFAKAIDDRTKLVSLSHVSYLTGIRHDLAAITALAHRHGALVVTDISHSLGAISVDLQAVDFAVSCAYKWILGIHGVGILYWNQRRQPDFQPLFVGQASVAGQRPPIDRVLDITLKSDASRATVGNETWSSLYVLRNGIKYIQSIGIERIEPHVLGLAQRVHIGLRDLGLQVITPAEPHRHAGNIVFWYPAWQKLWEELNDAKILVWAGDGRIRVSPFIYNDEEDVDRLLAFLAKKV
jgi:selenocysteine lyase/cysteine desulfurase